MCVRFVGAKSGGLGWRTHSKRCISDNLPLGVERRAYGGDRSTGNTVKTWFIARFIILSCQ
ncbi:MAG: hypothetical protein VKL59_26555 [Nostocaceae cyanobacterium]|nr:hypothetical protein [Nostocaceae cyanobacterium]